ncbi:MAG: hypothetical protein Q8K99_03600 [Actinomycetota bacterium]|nr:hypothetical protein [Actinomycetota bacterium]
MPLIPLVIVIAFFAWFAYTGRLYPVSAQRVPARASATDGAIARIRARHAMGEIDSEELKRIILILQD